MINISRMNYFGNFQSQRFNDDLSLIWKVDVLIDTEVKCSFVVSREVMDIKFRNTINIVSHSV